MRDRRGVAKYKAAIAELERDGLIEFTSEALREVTNAGYQIADDIASAHQTSAGGN